MKVLVANSIKKMLINWLVRVQKTSLLVSSLWLEAIKELEYSGHATRSPLLLFFILTVRQFRKQIFLLGAKNNPEERLFGSDKKVRIEGVDKVVETNQSGLARGYLWQASRISRSDGNHYSS